MDLTEPAEPADVLRQATLRSGVASQSATADRAPFDQRRTARHGTPCGAHVGKDDAR